VFPKIFEPVSNCRTEIGDADDLERWSADHFDPVVCNSVVEHVGTWRDMRNAAAEIRRVIVLPKSTSRSGDA
jgi:hypothetical protein